MVITNKQRHSWANVYRNILFWKCVSVVLEIGSCSFIESNVGIDDKSYINTFLRGSFYTNDIPARKLHRNYNTWTFKQRNNTTFRKGEYTVPC